MNQWDDQDFILELVNAWDCCGTCAAGVLARRDWERDAARVAATTKADDGLRAAVTDALTRAAIAIDRLVIRVSGFEVAWDRGYRQGVKDAAYEVREHRAALNSGQR